MDIFICDDNTLICNEINSLDSQIFQSNEVLNTLDFKFNKIHSLTDLNFSTLFQLTTVELFGNPIL